MPSKWGHASFFKASFWGLDPWESWTAENQNLILRVWSLPLICIKSSLWGLDFKQRAPFQRLILRRWSLHIISSWKSRPHFEVLIQSKRQNVALIASWPSAHFDHSVSYLQREKGRPKRAQIRPGLLHPHGYPPRASKRHTGRSWGYTRELTDILSVSYVGESVPGKYSLTIRRKKDRFGEVFPQKLIIYLRILDISSLNSHRKS